MTAPPTVVARRVARPRPRSGGSRLEVRCPYCGELHYHATGGPNRGDGDGVRVSECGEEYVVVEH